MSRVLFEEPLWLAIVLALLLFAVWGVWYRSRSGRAARTLLVAVVVIPVLFILQWLVITDAEQLERLTARLSSAVEAGDIEAVARLIDPDTVFDGGHDREDFTQHLGGLLKKYTVRNAVVRADNCEILGRSATLSCSARCSVSTDDWTYPVRSRWELRFAKKEDGWLITTIIPLQIADQRPGSFFSIH